MHPYVLAIAIVPQISKVLLFLSPSMKIYRSLIEFNPNISVRMFVRLNTSLCKQARYHSRRRAKL